MKKTRCARDSMPSADDHVRHALIAMHDQHQAIDELVERLLPLLLMVERNPAAIHDAGAEMCSITKALQEIFEAHLKLEEDVIFPAISTALPENERDMDAERNAATTSARLAAKGESSAETTLHVTLPSPEDESRQQSLLLIWSPRSCFPLPVVGERALLISSRGFRLLHALREQRVNLDLAERNIFVAQNLATCVGEHNLAAL